VGVLQKRVLLLTGNPGIGKTSVLVKTVNALKEKGYCVGGMMSLEAREGETRIGFEIFDLNSGQRGWLARVDQKAGPKVGKYSVNLEDLDLIGAKSIEDALKKCAVVVIDEIGPMELFSEKFKEATTKALESRKVILAVVHRKSKDRLIIKAKNREDSITFKVTQENRNELHTTLISTLYKIQMKKLG